MRRAILTAVLVDREDALDSACRAAEGLVYGVAQDTLGEASVEAGGARRRAGVGPGGETGGDPGSGGSGRLREGPFYGPLHSPGLGRPMGQETQHPERGWAQDIDRRPQSVDGLHELVCPAARDSFTLANGLARDREVVIGGAGPSDAVHLGVGVDLAPERGGNLQADKAEAARLRPVFPFDRLPRPEMSLARDGGLSFVRLRAHTTSE